MPPSRHGPNRLIDYLATHDTGFVCQDSLELQFMPMAIRMRGEISCLGDVVIAVNKTLKVVEPSDYDPVVQTLVYSYNASVRGFCNFLRHDNVHSHPGHPDAHHRHEYDWRTNQELCPPIWCGEEKWPTLGRFIEMAQGWYWEHHAELPEPDRCALIGVRGASPTA